MTQRKQLYILGALVALLLLLLIVFYGQSTSPLAATLGGDEKFVAIDVKDPALKLERLERIRKLAYPGMKRNIFSAELPAPPAPPVTARVEPPVVVDPGPPPLELPFKFYGLTVDPRSGKRRAFFTTGEDVIIASEGDTLMTRFRLLRIGNTSADFEELGSGRHATLSLEQPVQTPQG
jgi:hypothetical protein